MSAGFAASMVAKYEALLLANAGTVSCTVDGQTVTYADLEKKHAYWTQRAGRESGANPVVSQIDLGKFYNSTDDNS